MEYDAPPIVEGDDESYAGVSGVVEVVGVNDVVFLAEYVVEVVVADVMVVDVKVVDVRVANEGIAGAFAVVVGPHYHLMRYYRLMGVCWNILPCY